MTDLQAAALLYGGGKVETEGFVISSWFDDSTSEKNIEILNKETKRISCFVANGMSPAELKKKLERRLTIKSQAPKRKNPSLDRCP